MKYLVYRGFHLATQKRNGVIHGCDHGMNKGYIKKAQKFLGCKSLQWGNFLRTLHVELHSGDGTYVADALGLMPLGLDDKSMLSKNGFHLDAVRLALSEFTHIERMPDGWITLSKAAEKTRRAKREVWDLLLNKDKGAVIIWGDFSPVIRKRALYEFNPDNNWITSEEALDIAGVKALHGLYYRLFVAGEKGCKVKSCYSVSGIKKRYFWEPDLLEAMRIFQQHKRTKHKQ